MAPTFSWLARVSNTSSPREPRSRVSSIPDVLPGGGWRLPGSCSDTGSGDVDSAAGSGAGWADTGRVGRGGAYALGFSIAVMMFPPLSGTLSFTIWSAVTHVVVPSATL